MFTAVRRFTPVEIVFVEAPALVAALVVAEGFYKFHSFTLEALAFLATWLAFGGLLAAGRKALTRADDAA
jgi:hypothetical protein